MSEPSDIKHDTDILILLERGKRLTVNYGASKWEAVYWGRDEAGEIVAHQVQGKWRLTRIDLRRLADKLIDGDLLTRAEIKAIERDLTEDLQHG